MNPLPINDQGLLSGRTKGWLRWLPFLILLIAAVILLLAWERLPERWPVHWRVSGQVDDWAEKTPFGVFLPIGIGVAVCFFLEMIAVYIRAYPQSGKDNRVSEEAARAIAALTADFVRFIAIAVAFTLGSLAIALPLTRPERPTGFVLFVFVIVSTAVAIGIKRLMKGAQELKARGMFEGLEGWNGLIYSNPKDPRLWVPKITGIGYTINFGHRLSWLIMILILSVPLLTIIVIIALSR